MQRFYNLLGILLFCGLTPVIYAERFPIKTYTVADGLLRDTIQKVKQDSHGFLWFCTGEGASRFDGYAFTNFTADDGLPVGAVNDFLETRDGIIYLATDGGVAKLNPTQIQNPQSHIQSSTNSLFKVLVPGNPQSKAIQVLFEDLDGTVWIGTSNGLYQLNNQDEFVALNLGESRTLQKQIFVTTILKDRQGALWIGTQGSGLFWRKPDGEVRQFTAADGLPGNLVASLLEDRAGKLWAGMRPGATAGLVLLNPEPDEAPIVVRSFTTADGLPSDWVPALFEGSDGQMWLGTTDGLCQWQATDARSVCRTYTGENHLCDKDVWSVAEDTDGNLWTGSRCGAKKWSRFGFTTYGEQDGIETTEINSIFENQAGEMFASINNGRAQTIYQFDGMGKFAAAGLRLPAEVTAFGWGWQQTVRQDSRGAWLIPTGEGLFGFPPKTQFKNLTKVLPHRISPPKMEKEIFRVFEDSRGDYWVATSNHNELWRWERAANAWHDYTYLFDSGWNRIGTAFVEDRSGNLWIATGADAGGGELIRYRDGQFKIFTLSDHVPDGWMRDLYVDHLNRLWLANNKNGLLRLDDVNSEELNFARYSTSDGLSSAGAHCLTEDAFGRIYIGSARGVDRLNPETGQVENFTTSDGLPNIDIMVAYHDKNNNLWFGTAKGLARYTPEPARKRQPPRVLITGVRINGETQTVSILGEREINDVELNSDQRQISVDFLGLGASLGERLKYEYRLSGGDWAQTDERTINFANLATGAYQFQIRAVTLDRIASSPASFSFRIAAPIYWRPWFLFGCVLLVGCLVFSVYRYRVGHLLEMERVRMRIATDLHDDIGANLTKISILSEVAQQKLGKQVNREDDFNDGRLLENIAETSRESVSAMSDIVWAINPRKDSLVDLTRRMRRHAEEVLEQRGVLLQFNSTAAELRLNANVRRNVYLIFKESLNNIVRHAQASTVLIDFQVEQNWLVLIIADDGAGFETESETDGNGLPSIKKRAAELKAILEINSAPGDGATIIVRIGLRRKFWG